MRKLMKSTPLLAVLVLVWATAAYGTPFIWDGAPDGGGASADNDVDTAENWVGDVAPGDDNGNQHIFDGTPAQTTVDYGGGATANDGQNIVFADTLASDMTLTGKFRMTNDHPNITQNSSRAIDIAAEYSNEPEIGGTGTGTLTLSGLVKRFNGSGSVSSTIDNANFDIVWSGDLQEGNDDWKITKQGAGKLTLGGSFGINENGFLDVQGGTVELTGSTGSSNIRVNGGTFQGGSGTVQYNIDGAASDLMEYNAGSLDISALTIQFALGTLGATEDQYVLVDYSGAGVAPTLATNPATHDTFFAAADVPAGYSFFHDAANQQIVLLPEPATLALLGLGGAGLLLRRKRC